MGCTSSRNARDGVIRGENALDVSNGHNHNHRDVNVNVNGSNHNRVRSVHVPVPPNQLIDLTTIARRYNRPRHHDIHRNRIRNRDRTDGDLVVPYGSADADADANANANADADDSDNGNGDVNNIVADLELRQLQSDLETLERLFQSLLGQSFASQLVRNMELAQISGIGINFLSEPFPNNNNGNGGCPPAARDAIDNLPTIQIQPQDLLDECNRECCICFFGHELGDEVARLPCGHLFHKPCIAEWLTKKCTCPICRYEIRTDNDLYEVDRIERMRGRRIRLREHDLDRMSMEELTSLADWVNSSGDGDGNGNGNGNGNDRSSGGNSNGTIREIQNRNHNESRPIGGEAGLPMDRDNLVSSIQNANNVDMIYDTSDSDDNENDGSDDDDDDVEEGECRKISATRTIPQSSSSSNMEMDMEMDIDIQDNKHIVGTIPSPLAMLPPESSESESLQSSRATLLSQSTSTSSSSTTISSPRAQRHSATHHGRSAGTGTRRRAGAGTGTGTGTGEEEKEEIQSSLHVAPPMTNARQSSIVASNINHP